MLPHSNYPRVRRLLAAAPILLLLNACTTMPRTDPNRPDLPEILENLREAHHLLEAPLLFSGDFQQGWREQPEPGLEPARAELRATDGALHILAVLGDRDIGNRATGFNEKTWQIGDVFEIFIQVDADTYYEFHITPENRHLFLGWTTELFAAVRAGEATIEDAMIDDRDLLHSETRIHEVRDYWTVRARIPFEKIGLDPDRNYPGLKVAFARYDSFGDDRSAVLSATADFPAINYHDRSAWHPVSL